MFVLLSDKMGIFKKTYKTLLSTILSVLVIYGSSGISAEKHSCQHCGTDYNIALFSYGDDKPDRCCGESASETDTPSQCKMTTDSCCSYEVESIGLSEHLATSAQIENFSQLYSIAKTDGLLFSFELAPIYNNYYPPDSFGGRKLVILNSQYLT